MMTLSPDDRETIETWPLEDAFAKLLSPLQEAEQLQRTSTGSHKARDVTVSLLSALLAQRAALRLRLNIEGRPDFASRLRFWSWGERHHW